MRLTRPLRSALAVLGGLFNEAAGGPERDGDVWLWPYADGPWEAWCLGYCAVRYRWGPAGLSPDP